MVRAHYIPLNQPKGNTMSIAVFTKEMERESMIATTNKFSNMVETWITCERLTDADYGSETNTAIYDARKGLNDQKIALCKDVISVLSIMFPDVAIWITEEGNK
jgi:hypothetical protein